MIVLLPVETICAIAELCTLEGQALLSRSCRFLYEICNPILYRNDIRNYRSSSVFYALVRAQNQTEALRILVKARAAGDGFVCCQDSRKHHPLSFFRLDAKLFSPMKLAVRRGLDDIVSYFIKEGLPVDGADRADSFRNTPLMEAIRCHQELTAVLLIRNGASIGPEVSNSEAFQSAIREGLPRLVIAIVERYGLDVNDDIGYGCTPLILAAWHRRESMIPTLLGMGADAMPAMRRLGEDHAFASILWILEAGSAHLRDSFTLDHVTELIILFVTQRGATVHRNQQILAVEAFLKLLDKFKRGPFCLGIPSVEDVDRLLDALLQMALSVDLANTRLATLLMKWGATIQSFILLQLLEILKPSIFDVDVLRCLRRHPGLLQCFDFVYSHCSLPSRGVNGLVRKHFLEHVSTSAVQLVEKLKRYDLPLTARGVEILQAEVSDII